MDIEATETHNKRERERGREEKKQPKEKKDEEEILYRSNNIVMEKEKDKKEKDMCVYRDDRLGIMFAVRHMKYSVDEIIK